MRDLDVSVRVLVDGKCIDYAHRVALSEAFQLGDDLAMEVWLAEAKDEQLYRANRHISIPSVVDVQHHARLRTRAGIQTRFRSPLAGYTRVAWAQPRMNCATVPGIALTWKSSVRQVGLTIILQSPGAQPIA